jgi:hypothetical protein
MARRQTIRDTGVLGDRDHTAMPLELAESVELREALRRDLGWAAPHWAEPSLLSDRGEREEFRQVIEILDALDAGDLRTVPSEQLRSWVERARAEGKKYDYGNGYGEDTCRAAASVLDWLQRREGVRSLR